MALSERASRIVEDARRAYAPTAPDRVRVRQALAVRLAVGVTLTSGIASAGTAWTVASKVVAVGLGASAIVGAGVVTYELAPRFTPPEPAPVRPTVVASSVPSGTARAGSEPQPEAFVVPSVEPAPARPEPVARVERAAGDRGSTVAAPPASAGRRPDVEAELVLLGSAQRALSSGDAARALELTEQHARAFPSGTLAEERRATRIVALCALGRHSEGRHEAREFLARSGNSPLAERVRTACSNDGVVP